MKYRVIDPPRVFGVGKDKAILLKDCARVRLSADEQVTFETEAGGEYDVVRKSWGFYATPSLNGRLPSFGLWPALIKSYDGKYFLMLVERGQEEAFSAYLQDNGLALVRWLKDDAELAQVWPERPGRACLCGGRRLETAFLYNERPAGETLYPFAQGKPYRREVWRCLSCGHMISVHDMNEGALYDGAYVSATYGEKGMQAAFDRICALPPEKSDNAGRVARVNDFAARHFPQGATGRSILDVGSGLCVFLHAMKRSGWDAVALDPDARAARHAEEVVHARALCGDFMTLPRIGAFDAVTFNKVLEHVLDPAAMLARAAGCLKPGGFVYAELPDGEAAAAAGPGREEFFIEHHHVFSAASTGVLAARAGFVLRELERLREPSGKFTLRAFLVRRENP